MTWFRSSRVRRGISLFAATVAIVAVASCSGDSTAPDEGSPAAVTGQQLGAGASGLFELDGNALASASVAGDDWETLYNGGGSSDVYVFVSDKGMESGTAVIDPIFKSASDVNAITTWNFVVADTTKPGGLPPKDNITNAYAAAYHNGDMYLFFGMDRFTANGTADIGFWFLKGAAGPVPDPGCNLTTVGCTGVFAGEHQVGDVLVLSAFTNGGSVDTIEVYKWVGSGGNAGGGVLDLLFSGTGVDCRTAAGAAANACASVNNQDEDSPWMYQAGENAYKNLPDVFPSDHFFEGGINLTNLGIAGCFNTFMAETRSSSSLTAQLKDFALGAFNVCSVDVQKGGPTDLKTGDQATYNFTITNTGSYPLVMRSISDNKLGDLAGVAPAACDSLAPDAVCSFSATHTPPAGAPDPYVNEVTVVYSESATATDTYSDKDTHSVNLFTPSVAAVMTAPALSKVGDTVTFTLTVSNTSSVDTPTLNCGVSALTLGAVPSSVLSISSGGVLAFPGITYTIPSNSNPAVDLFNSATVLCSIGDGTLFSNTVSAPASTTVNLFKPSIVLGKAAKPYSKNGDTVQYTLTLTNTSTADTPALTGCTVSDTLITSAMAAQNLGLAGSSISWTPSRTVQAGDADPLVNTATATCNVSGFPNAIASAPASASTDLIHPNLTATITCSAPSKTVTAPAPAPFTAVINNTGDANLVVQVAYPPAAATQYLIPAGGSVTLNSTASYAPGATSVSKALSAIWTLGVDGSGVPYGLPNTATLNSSDTCIVLQDFEGCTPGAWKNPNGRLQLWDSPTDAIPMVTGFYIGTLFHTYFGVGTNKTGLSSTLTMEQALNLGGGGVEKLARHGVAALLNVGAGLNYNYPAGATNVASLKTVIANALFAKTYEPLASQLDSANNEGCPVLAP